MEMFSKRLCDMLAARDETDGEIADSVGVSRQTVSAWRNGTRSPKKSIIPRLADFLGVSIPWLMGIEGDASTSAIRVPVLGTIPAGVPLEAIEEVLDWEEIPLAWGRGGKEYFALKISGDSMAPRYEPGDVIICRRQEKCESGQDAVVMVNSDDATFKRVRVSDAGITLQPLNPAYDPLFFTTRQVEQLPVRIIGVAVEIRRTI